MVKILKTLMIMGTLLQGTMVVADYPDFQVNIISKSGKDYNYDFQTNGNCTYSNPDQCHWYNWPDNDPMNLEIQQTLNDQPTNKICNFSADPMSGGGVREFKQVGGKNCEAFFHNEIHQGDPNKGEPTIITID